MECQRGLATKKLSVRPSVKRVDCDKTEERSVWIFYTVRKIIYTIDRKTYLVVKRLLMHD